MQPQALIKTPELQVWLEAWGSVTILTRQGQVEIDLERLGELREAIAEAEKLTA